MKTDYRRQDSGDSYGEGWAKVTLPLANTKNSIPKTQNIKFRRQDSIL